MAHDISETYERKVVFPNLPHLHAMIALHKPIRLLRTVLRSLDMGRQDLSYQFKPEITQNFEAASMHYRSHHWAFVDEVFPPDFHELLVAQFPKRRYLDPPKTIYKSYDIGFKWERGRRGGAKHIDLFPSYRRLLDFFCSVEFSKRVTEFSGSVVPLTCRSFLVNKTYPGSLVIPHKDDPIPAKFTPYLNMVFALDGTGGKDSGQLILARDNEYRDIVFEPPNVRNSCVVYDTEAPLYHGFKPVAFGKYRIALTASFAREDYDPHVS